MLSVIIQTEGAEGPAVATLAALVPGAAALVAAARQARSPWLMFLHAGAVLEAGWLEETTQFIQRVSGSERPRAGIFRYARSPYAETGFREALKWLGRIIAGPGADQGLVIA